MKKQILAWLIFISLNYTLQADIAYLSQSGHERVELSPSQTDFVRENLIHIFDSSSLHQMYGGRMPVKSQKQIERQLEKVKSGSFIELHLNQPARIVVEGNELEAIRMWVRIRESDGFVYDWILQQPNGDLVALEKARGELIVQLAPHILGLLKPTNEPIGGDQ